MAAPANNNMAAHADGTAAWCEEFDNLMDQTSSPTFTMSLRWQHIDGLSALGIRAHETNIAGESEVAERMLTLATLLRGEVDVGPARCVLVDQRTHGARIDPFPNDPPTHPPTHTPKAKGRFAG